MTVPSAPIPRRPRRREDLEISEVVDGYVVYDPAHDRVHYLNRTAAVVLELCDGELDVPAMVALVGSAWDLPEPPDEEVRACLARFAAEGLVDDGTSRDPDQP